MAERGRGAPKREGKEMIARLWAWLRSLFGGKTDKENNSADRKNEFRQQLEKLERERDLKQVELKKLDRDLDVLEENERAAIAEFNATTPDSPERKKALEKIAEIRKRIADLKPARAALRNGIAANDKLIAELRKIIHSGTDFTPEEVEALQRKMKQAGLAALATYDTVKHGEYVEIEDNTEQELRDLERELTAKAAPNSSSPSPSARTDGMRREIT
ncbi:MAG: hypothetical protein ONB24_14835 [candidate division KSB1 bacterium]|nr:hypothetical protein [candidate division KSB1 bacterium]